MMTIWYSVETKNWVHTGYSICDFLLNMKALGHLSSLNTLWGMGSMMAELHPRKLWIKKTRHSFEIDNTKMTYDSHNPSTITWLGDKGVCYKYSNLKIKFRTDGEMAPARQISTKEETSESIQYVLTGYNTHPAAIMKTSFTHTHTCVHIKMMFPGSHRCIFIVRMVIL